MASSKKLKPSEFEGPGPYPSGVVGSERPWEQLRLVYRTGQDTSSPESVDLNAQPSKKEWTGGGGAGTGAEEP